jgi:hypothetical protein
MLIHWWVVQTEMAQVCGFSLKRTKKKREKTAGVRGSHFSAVGASVVIMQIAKKATQTAIRAVRSAWPAHC